LAALIALIVFGGLRYETGFDWVEYEQYLYFSPRLGDTNLYISIDTFEAEPGFALLNILFRTAGLGFQWLAFSIAAFNLIVLYRFISRYTPLVALIFLWYFGILFLTGQMSTMRQALSVSFIYLAIMSIDRGKSSIALLMSAAAVAFHTFSLAFLPFIFITRNPPKFSLVIFLAIAGFSITLGGTDFFRLFATNVLSIVDGGLISSKIAIYASFEAASISMFALLLLLWNLLFFGVSRFAIDRRWLVMDRFALTGLWMTFASIIAHTYLATFPIVWNRLMMVTFVLQAIVYTRIVLSGQSPIRTLSPIIGGLGVLSGASLTFLLTGSQALVFKPYQSMAIVWVRGPYGDGRLRYQVIRGENDQIARETKN
jgi:hypothetical protein